MISEDEPQTDAEIEDEKDPAIHDDVPTYHKMVGWLRNESALADGLIDKFHAQLEREKELQEEAAADQKQDPNAANRDSLGA